MPDQLTPEKTESIIALRASGLTFTEISMITCVSRDICMQIIDDQKTWPKLFTRITPEGKATIVRIP